MMQQRCENCDKPLLPTDAVCWHCGQARQGHAVTPERAAAAETTALPTAAFGYGLWTLLIVVALLLVIRSLAQQPLIVVNSDAERPRDWQIITDSAQRFTLDLPPDWQVVERGDPAFAAVLAEEEVWKTAVSPLEPTTILLLATSPTNDEAGPHYLAVARNIQLHELSADQISQFISRDGHTIQQIEEDESFFNTPQINLSFPTQLGSETLLCQQQYALQAENSYLLTLCAPETQARRHRDRTEAIQASFQPLSQ